MKHFSKIALLALAIGLACVVLFSMHGRTVKAQESTASTNNTQVALFCPNAFKYDSIIGQDACSSWEQIAQPGYNEYPYSIPSGYTLVITDMECATSVPTGGENGQCWLYNTLSRSLCSCFAPYFEAGALSGP